MTIRVRKAGPDDEEAVRRVGDEAFSALRSIYRPNAAAHASLVAAAPSLDRLVAEDADEIVGTVRFGVSGDRLRVIGLAVDVRHRRRGVARMLTEELVRIAGDRGCRALGLHTVTKTGNVPVFEHLGFHVVSEQLDEYSIGVEGTPLMDAYMERAVD